MEKAEILAKIKKMSDYIGDNFHIVDHSLYRNKSKEHYKSYSTISKALTWDKFQHIPKRYLDEASLRGSQIHDAIEQTFLMGLEVFPVDEKYEIYFRGFQRFWFDNEIEVIAIEERFVDEDKKTSGKIDFIGFLDGKLTVIDWKTSKILDKWTMGLQLYIYAQGLAKWGIEAEDLKVVQLTAKGEYNVLDIDKNLYPLYDKIYNSLLEVHQYRQIMGIK